MEDKKCHTWTNTVELGVTETVLPGLWYHLLRGV